MNEETIFRGVIRNLSDVIDLYNLFKKGCFLFVSKSVEEANDWIEIDYKEWKSTEISLCLFGLYCELIQVTFDD